MLGKSESPYSGLNAVAKTPTEVTVFAQHSGIQLTYLVA